MSKAAMRSRTSWDPQQAHTDFELWTAVGTTLVAGLAPKGPWGYGCSGEPVRGCRD